MPPTLSTLVISGHQSSSEARASERGHVKHKICALPERRLISGSGGGGAVTIERRRSLLIDDDDDDDADDDDKKTSQHLAAMKLELVVVALALLGATPLIAKHVDLPAPYNDFCVLDANQNLYDPAGADAVKWQVQGGKSAKIVRCSCSFIFLPADLQYE